MKKQLLVMGALCAILFTGSLNWTACSAQKATAENSPETTAAPEAAQQKPAEPKFITELKAQIKGKEEMPAEEVFKNIKILKGMPAGRVIPIMQMAFNRSLGVRCDHCHEFGKWELDTKPAKQVTRDMWAMTGKINRGLLKEIPNLQSEQPVVNCTTCHRGDVKPATSL